MSLKPPRRIFQRQKRRNGTLVTLRTAGVLAFGFLLAFGATVAAFDAPLKTQSSGNAAQPETQALPGRTPVMRIAAASAPGARSQQH